MRSVMAHKVSSGSPTWDPEKNPFLRNVHLSVLHEEVLCALDKSICTWFGDVRQSPPQMQCIAQKQAESYAS